MMTVREDRNAQTKSLGEEVLWAEDVEKIHMCKYLKVSTCESSRFLSFFLQQRPGKLVFENIFDFYEL